MERRLIVLLFVLAMTGIETLGQTKACEAVYQVVDNNPTYDGGMSALMDYSAKHLTTIISRCQSKDKELTTKLAMILTIDADGKVIDAELSNHKLMKDCEEQLRKKLLTMSGWTPGSLNVSMLLSTSFSRYSKQAFL